MSGEGFLSRWSRRKRAAEAGRPVEEPEAPEVLVTPAEATAPPAPPVAAEEPEFDVSTLPPVESLTAESDFAAFLRKGVPEALKRAALRKAWSLDPAIRDFVGPADYAWDYNAPDGVPGFSLELPGDVQKMVAQVLGLDREEKDEAEAAAPPVAAAEAEAAPPAEVASAEEAAPPATIAALPEDSTPALPAEPPRMAARRHGSALPS